MAKWYGRLGYGHTAEVQNGVWEDVITERNLYGDVERNTRRLVGGGLVNANLTTTSTISVMADTYALENIFAIRYVEWMGALWIVDNVDVQRPRLILSLGGVYNGPRRLLLQGILEGVLGSTNVYFQPPPSLVMQYPAIVYSRESTSTKFANNLPYNRTKRYQVTVIDRSPVSPIPDKVGELPMCTHENHLVVDGLNQDVFTLYF